MVRDGLIQGFTWEEKIINDGTLEGRHGVNSFQKLMIIPTT